MTARAITACASAMVASFIVRSIATASAGYRTVPPGPGTSDTGIIPRRNVEAWSSQYQVPATTAKMPESRRPRANSAAVRYGVWPAI